MTTSTSTFPVIDQLRIGQLEATITTAVISRDSPDGISNCDYILEIRRHGDYTLLAPHQYTLSDLPINSLGIRGDHKPATGRSIRSLQSLSNRPVPAHAEAGYSSLSTAKSFSSFWFWRFSVSLLLIFIFLPGTQRSNQHTDDPNDVDQKNDKQSWML